QSPLARAWLHANGIGGHARDERNEHGGPEKHAAHDDWHGSIRPHLNGRNVYSLEDPRRNYWLRRPRLVQESGRDRSEQSIIVGNSAAWIRSLTLSLIPLGSGRLPLSHLTPSFDRNCFICSTTRSFSSAKL